MDVKIFYKTNSSSWCFVVCGSTQKKADPSIDQERRSKADAGYLSTPAISRSRIVQPRPWANSDEEREGRGTSKEGRTPTEVVKKFAMADKNLNILILWIRM